MDIVIQLYQSNLLLLGKHTHGKTLENKTLREKRLNLGRVF